MSAVENMFLGMGFSWTLSKALPYILAILIGVVLIILFKKKLKHNALLKWAFRVSLLIIPFAAYFIYSPIYEGDFSNSSVSIARSDSHSELKGNKLVILSIPNCPYCYESIDRIVKLKERVPDAEIEYIVCGSNDPMSTEWYKEKGGDNISVVLADSSEALSIMAEGRFPTFVLVSGEKDFTVWSNDNFGVMAMDEVELKLK